MSLVSPQRISEIVSDETVALGGRVHDLVQDDSRLFMRTVLRHREAIKLNDEVDGGVAVRVDGPSIWVQPYTFRLVCQNGAIIPQISEADMIETTMLPSIEVIEERLRVSYQDCARAEHLDTWVQQVRPMNDPTYIALLFGRISRGLGTEFLEVMEHFKSERDFTGFGFMNAITAYARGVADPERRWRLEEIGGGLPALLQTLDSERDWADALDLPIERSRLVPA